MPKETKEVILKKVERIKSLLNDLDQLLGRPFDRNDRITIGASQRFFELAVELASDINASLILDKTGETPDSYREAFSGISKLGFDPELTDLLVEGAKERNILVHEYDFDADEEKFYHTAKRILPAFRKYLKFVNDYLENLEK